MTTYPLPTPTNMALTPLEMEFGDTVDDVVQPTLEEHPYLQYMTGNLTTTTFKTAVGWHVRVGVNPALDKLLASRGVEQYVVQHKTGEVQQVPYWNLSWEGHPCSLIIIAHGVKSPWQMKENLADRTGVVYGTGIVKDEQGTIQYKENSNQPKKKLHLQFRVFVHELVGTNERPLDGFNEWFQVSLSNHMVDAMFAVFNAQYPVIDAFNASMVQQGKPNRARYWGFSIPTVVSSEGKKVGPDPLHQSTIFPMVARIPQLRAGTSETMEYLRTHRIPVHIQQRLLDGLLEETVVWSVVRSAEIVEGKQEQATTTVEMEEPIIEATSVVLPQLAPAEDRPVDVNELNWIIKGYCMGNQSFVKTVCQRFGVAEPPLLRKNHYDILQFESAQYAKQS